MEIRLEEMREIARTLPIGYYLGLKVPVFVEPGDSAYCDVVKGEIHIGVGLLQSAADQIDAADAAKWSREALLRCLLYHECGHILLSPKWLKEPFNLPRKPDGYSDPDGAELVNIFEDERLEQILSQFFLGVDFKGFARLVHKRGTTSTRCGKFLKAVRLRQTTPEISAAVDAAVQKLVWCNSQSNYYDSCDDGKKYRDVLTELVNMIAPYSEPKPEEQKPQPEQPQPDEQQPEQPQPDEQQPEQEQPDEQQPEQEQPDEQQPEQEQPDEQQPEQEQPDEQQPDEDNSEDETTEQEQKPAEMKLPRGFLSKMANQVFVTPLSSVENTLKRFAERLAKRKGAQAAGKWSALHGRMDARRDALDKERIFCRTSDIGANMMTSVHLTLWVDCSGSFCANERTLNQILAATSKAMSMSGGKLTVDVVKMGCYASVANQHDWLIVTGGGNDIDESYSRAWRRTRRRDRRNIDLVVFDGACNRAISHIATYNHVKEEVAKLNAKGVTKVRLRGVRGGLRGLKKAAESAEVNLKDVAKIATSIWDHPDCHIISDPSNKPLFDRLDKAHVIYVDGNYAGRLQDEVMKTLDRIL